MSRNFTSSTDTIIADPGSQLWTKSVEVINDGSHRFSHPMPFELDDGRLLCGYCDNVSSALFGIKCVRSNDVGATWTDLTATTIYQDGSKNTYECDFAQTASNNLVAVYGISSTSGGGSNTNCKISTDRGGTWGSAIAVSGAQTENFDPHPTICKAANGDLICIYQADFGAVMCKISSNGGTSWGSANQIATSYTAPSVRAMSSGKLVCAVQKSGTNGVASSTTGYYLMTSSDNGASWTSPAKFKSSIIEINDDVNLCPLGGKDLAAFFSQSSEAGGDRWNLCMLSHDEGATWVYEMGVYAGSDPHRINAIKTSGGSVLAVCACKSGSDSDYHLDLIVPPSGWPKPNWENLTSFTACIWYKYAGTANAANSHWLLNRAVLKWIPLYMIDNGSTSYIAVYFDRAATATDGGMTHTTVADNTWTFVACVVDGLGCDIKLYAGTTTANLADTTGSITMGSGDYFRNDGNPLYIGCRSTTDRTMVGLLSHVSIVGKPCSLAELQRLMSAGPVMEGQIVFPLNGSSPEPSNMAGITATVSGTAVGTSFPPVLGPEQITKLPQAIKRASSF